MTKQKARLLVLIAPLVLLTIAYNAGDDLMWLAVICGVLGFVTLVISIFVVALFVAEWYEGLPSR